ncbi:MAG: hypothetical protein A2Y10_14755 [Planctomycetes bacterium GWF2_41_51]|nr:MAG: hypothetical protein A2Y10_14755 [Planctomycetes bacterium GWF2_41_51]HBG28997.1 hypothetical protein [Phycisphaerales bacterium]
MELKLNLLILLPIFIILLVIIFRIFKDSLKVDIVPSVILSICVSILAMIGLNSNTKGIKGITGTILIPYVALAICVLFAPLLDFLFKTNKKPEDEFPKTPEKNSHYDTDEKRKFKTDRNRIRR